MAAASGRDALKDNGKRGGSKRWTGNGPQPARHIPWPEIFKHHLSVVEGHLKVLDMIRKHTLDGTSSHRTIVACLERARRMLQDTKEATRNFVPPAEQREQVPIGSSSVPMYPSYSPADHQYGHVASEFGQAWSRAKQDNAELKTEPNGPVYKFEQGHARRKGQLKEIREVTGENGEKVIELGGMTESAANEPSGAAPVEETNPYFVIDSKPTPVNLPGVFHKPMKRTGDVENGEAVPEPMKSKKPKIKHEANVTDGSPVVEKDDIEAEVDARLKEKEQRKFKKDKRKRRRESEGSAFTPAMGLDAADKMDIDEEKTEKPKRKKRKKTKDGATDDGAAPTETTRPKAEKIKTSKKSKKEKG